MSQLRRLSTVRLIALVAGICAVLAGGTALAAGVIGGGGPKPPDKPLANAIHDAASAARPEGVTARIEFTNKLIDSSSVGRAAGPLIAGASGRLWAANDGRLRLELQSDRGDAQIVSDGKTVTLYDATSNTAYELKLPAEPAGKQTKDAHAPPTLAAIERFLKRLGTKVDLSGATPDNVAGREAYTVKVAPAHDGGLIGAGRLSFDAANGAPLRLGVYAAGNPSPVLELTATDIQFGPVSNGDLSATPPAGAKIVKVGTPGGGAAGHPNHAARHRGEAAAVTGPKAVAAQLPFTLSAPDTLVGLPRKDVRLITRDGTKGALVTYGAGLGGIVVFEQAAGKKAPAKQGDGEHSQLSLPQVSIGNVSGQELATALGTMVRFQRAGVQYTIVGSVPPAAAEAAARGL